MRRLFLAVVVCAILGAVPARAGDDPADAIRRFFQSFAEGKGGDPFWAEASRRELFAQHAEAMLRSRCLVIESMRIGDLDAAATTDVTLLLTKQERATGKTWGPLVADYRVALVREKNGWRIRAAESAAVSGLRRTISRVALVERHQGMPTAGGTG